MIKCEECKNSNHQTITRIDDTGQLFCLKCYNKWIPVKSAPSSPKPRALSTEQRNAEKIRILNEKIQMLEKKVDYLMNGPKKFDHTKED